MKNKNVLVRTDRAGVFAGTLKSRTGSEVVLTNARRLWCWDGAASLSQLAVDGVKRPQNCKFLVAVPEITLLGVLEIIPMTDRAVASVASVPVWEE